MKKQRNYALRCMLCTAICISKTIGATGQTPGEQPDTTRKSKLDINIITVPFKIRPAVKGFPVQLNTNFSTALYIGKRKDILKIGYSYGILLGIGAVAMNPHVTQQKITEEYDGFVSSLGLAGLYDTRRFNLGLAAGLDHLIDKNRSKWIYQHKVWLGVLFGIHLN